MGSGATPLLTGLEGAKELPNACTLRALRETCPMQIPYPNTCANCAMTNARNVSRHSAGGSAWPR
jgi:L-lactate utilization protein LutB